MSPLPHLGPHPCPAEGPAPVPPTAPPPPVATMLASNLEGHELVVGLGGPGVDLHRVLERDDQELDPLVLHCRQNEEGVTASLEPPFGDSDRQASPAPRVQAGPVAFLSHI